jgi:cytochrome c-type biogenesis protein CcmE
MAENPSDPTPQGASPTADAPVQPAPLARPSTLFTLKTKAAFALVIVAGALIYFGYVAFQGATVAYHSVAQASALGPTPQDRAIGVKGKLVQGSYVRSPDGLVANFRLRDEDGPVQIPVRYSGEIGQVFFNEHSEIILQGALGNDRTFTAELLTVRCPSKYLTEAERAELDAQKRAEPRPEYKPG